MGSVSIGASVIKICVYQVKFCCYDWGGDIGCLHHVSNQIRILFLPAFVHLCEAVAIVGTSYQKLKNLYFLVLLNQTQVSAAVEVVEFYLQNVLYLVIHGFQHSQKPLIL